MANPALQPVLGLIQALDQAVLAHDDTSRCRLVKEALQEAVESRQPVIAGAFLRTAPAGYARRLLHRDPAGRYTVVVMVWDHGQGTGLHDHAGRWCVECVYRGRVLVENFSRQADRDSASGVLDFREESRLVTGVGDAGALIPPFEYHRLSNPHSTPAVTIHVYGGELDGCNVYELLPQGGYVRQRKALSYTPD